MDYNVLISEMYAGEDIEGYYILKEAFSKTTASGKPFLSGILSDKTGTVELKLWDYSGPVGAADAGKIVKVRGTVSDFRGAPQLVASRIRLAEEGDNYSLSNIIPTAPVDADAMLGFIRALISGMQDEDYRRVCSCMLERHLDEFKRIPAAKKVHHGFLSGLLMHTGNMLRLADFLAGVYPDVINRDLLISGTLLHDFAKAREFTFSELGLVTDYTVQGNLIGHLVMGAQEIADVCRELDIPGDKSVLLQHMILSHHGQPEFGAAVVPQCAEAELLYYIDSIDSRMEIYSEVFQDLDENSFSGRIFALEKKIYRHS